MNPTYDFSDQVALVTGAGAGMGLDTARAFAAAAVSPRIGAQRPRALEVVKDEVRPGRLAQASPGRPPSWW